MQAKKNWGETILSPQYLEKYWDECPTPNCSYESAPMQLCWRSIRVDIERNWATAALNLNSYSPDGDMVNINKQCFRFA